MKIGIDARMLGSKQGGIGRYIHQMTNSILGIICHPRENGDPKSNDWIPDQVGNDKAKLEFVIFLRKENWDLVEENSRLKKVLADISWYGWREQLFLPGIIKKEKIDLMHFPHWNIPFLYRKPFIVTIHDLLLLHYPTRASSTLGPLTYFFKNIAYKIILRHAIKKSRHIIAPSEFTKNDIIKTFKIESKKITVTHLAPVPIVQCHCERNEAIPRTSEPINLQSSKNSEIATSSLPTGVPPRNDIKKPYVLYVGVAYPHKNLEGLIDAWKIFCAEHGNDYQLVLAGRKNYFYEKLQKKANDMFNCHSEQSEESLEADDKRPFTPLRCVQEDSIIFTDYVPDEDLPMLYKNASLYVFPSFYEGFGLPPLEAMQYGVPVVSSNSTCLPEILKDAVLYFDPSNKKEISDSIWRGLTDQNLRQELNQKSIQLIHNYDWKTTAKTTLETYLNVI